MILFNAYHANNDYASFLNNFQLRSSAEYALK